VVSDWLDGKIARLWNMRSVWGERLDPIADRVLVAVVPLTFVVAGYIPVWTVAVLLARDALLVGTLPVYRRRGVEPEVTYLGKAATVALFWSLPLILAGHAGVWGAEALHILGEACLFWGAGRYAWRGGLYLCEAGRVARTVGVNRSGSRAVQDTDGV